MSLAYESRRSNPSNGSAPGKNNDTARFEDYTDRAGAEIIKARIEAYWRERGYEVQIMLVDAPFAPELRAGRVDVRSEMMNGLPRRMCANTGKFKSG